MEIESTDVPHLEILVSASAASHVRSRPAARVVMGTGSPAAGDGAAEPSTAIATTPQPTTLALTNDLITIEDVSGRLTALSNRTDLAAAARTNALSLYIERNNG
jgi:hypothetical protein